MTYHNWMKKEHLFVLERINESTNMEHIEESSEIIKNLRESHDPEIVVGDFELWRGFDQIELVVDNNYFCFDCEDLDTPEIKNYFDEIVDIIRQAIADWSELNPVPNQLSMFLKQLDSL